MLRFADDIPRVRGNKNELQNALIGINQILVDGTKMKINKRQRSQFVLYKETTNETKVYKNKEKEL